MIQPNSLILTAGLLVSLTILAALGVVIIRLGRQGRSRPVGPEGGPQSGRARLENLEPQEISFLGKHPALARTFIRELRRERRKVLREYLRSLREEFDRTCAEIRAAIVASSEDRPDLVSALFKEQVRFKLGLLQAECSMTLEALGLATLDFDAIIDSLGSIRLDVKLLITTAEREAI